MFEEGGGIIRRGYEALQVSRTPVFEDEGRCAEHAVFINGLCVVRTYLLQVLGVSHVFSETGLVQPRLPGDPGQGVFVVQRYTGVRPMPRGQKCEVESLEVICSL